MVNFKYIKISVLLVLPLLVCMYVAKAQNCIQINPKYLTERQQKAVNEVSVDVCKIFGSDEFKEKVIARKWLASCNTGVDEKPDEILGEDVYKIITSSTAQFSVKPQKLFRATGKTDRVKKIVRIIPSRIEDWYAEKLTDRSKLVNTIAHETMHIISNRFNDRGHGKEACMDCKLVSYGIGDLVEEIWISKKQ